MFEEGKHGRELPYEVLVAALFEGYYIN